MFDTDLIRNFCIFIDAVICTIALFLEPNFTLKVLLLGMLVLLLQEIGR